MSCNAVDWLAESVTNPSQSSLSDLMFHRHLTRALPQRFITELNQDIQVAKKSKGVRVGSRPPPSVSSPICDCKTNFKWLKSGVSDTPPPPRQLRGIISIGVVTRASRRSGPHPRHFELTSSVLLIRNYFARFGTIGASSKPLKHL